MAPIVDDLRKNLGVAIEQYEAWHNEENLKKFREYDKNFCGGVPFFINTDTGKSICGEAAYDAFLKWAQGAAVADNHSPLNPHTTTRNFAERGLNHSSSFGVGVKNIDYSHITDGIYIGTNQCCQTHFDEELRKEGIEADISLEEERIDAPFGIQFYTWLPIKNHEAPTDEQFDFGVAILGKLVAMKKKIYVHCKNGHGRAPLLVAAHLVSTGKTPEEALSLITSARPATHLNDLQMTSLKNFQKCRKLRESDARKFACQLFCRVASFSSRRRGGFLSSVQKRFAQSV